MFRTFYDEPFDGTEEVLVATLEGALAALGEHGWFAPGGEFPARLCLEEAMTNAARHGTDHGDRSRLRLQVAENGERCRIRVFDAGEGFDPERLVMPPPGHEGGRGVCLMRHFMEEVAYNDALGCLELTFGRGCCRAGEE